MNSFRKNKMNLLRKENMFSLVSLSKSILLTRVAIVLFVAFVLHWCRSCCTYAALVLLVLHCCFQRLIIYILKRNQKKSTFLNFKFQNFLKSSNFKNFTLCFQTKHFWLQKIDLEKRKNKE